MAGTTNLKAGTSAAKEKQFGQKLKSHAGVPGQATSRTGPRPGPSTRLGFVQNGLLFHNRDDVDEYQSYYEVFSSGKVELVPAYTGGRQTFANDPDGTSRSAGWSLGSMFPGRMPDIRRGRVENGQQMTPEVLVAFAVAAEQMTGLDIQPRAADGTTSWQVFQSLSEAQRMLKPGQDLKDTEQYQILAEHYGAKDPFGDKSLGASGINKLNATGGRGSTPGGNSFSGGAASGDRASGGSGGLGGDLGLSGFSSNLPPGNFNGATITQETLNEFLESNFTYAFNAMLNQHRDAGAASVFLKWLDEQFFRYQSEYLGTLGQQALNGQAPKGAWTSFLVDKGLMPESVGSSTARDQVIQQFQPTGTQDGQAAGSGGQSQQGSQPSAGQQTQAPATIGVDNISALLGI